MPTYDYRCSKCGHEFRKFHKMSAKRRPRCPECGASTEQQITGGAGLHFKGSGFYVTDYKKADKGDKADTADTGGKADTADKADKPSKADKSARAGDAGAKGKKGDSPRKGSDS
jgi:putative FmdB family regulatory protein